MEQKEVEQGVAQGSGNIHTQLEESINRMEQVEENTIVDGIVVAVTEDTVFLDVNCKSEAKLALSEFDEAPKVGDKVSVYLISQFGKSGPQVSKKKADEKRLWVEFKAAADAKTPVDGKIVSLMKGGYTVDLGGDITAFLPVSQADAQKVEKPEDLVGLKSKFYIERLYGNNGKHNVVVNRRKYLEEEIDVRREKFFNDVKIGDTVKGTVKSFTSFGAFIDLGAFDGLLHINDMSWGHVTKPKEFVKKGQEIELKVIRLDPEEKRINLSLKHFSEDPWIHFEEKYHVNDIVKGKVTKLIEYGAFIELEEGIEGLAHISEFSWTKKINKPSDMVKEGDELECMILGYDIQAGRVSLGIKQVTQNPWETVAEKYAEGTKLTGKVVKITNSGAFVQLEEGIDAFLAGADISWTKKVKHPGSELKVDQEIECVVIECNAEEHKINVGIKQLTDNPWKAFAAEYSAGDTLEGEVTSINEFGIFVKAPNGIEGLVNKQNLSEDRDTPFEEAVKKYNIGDKVNVFVVSVDVARERVAFSVKEFKKAQARAEISQYMASSNDNGSYTIGDMLKNQAE